MECDEAFEWNDMIINEDINAEAPKRTRGRPPKNKQAEGVQVGETPLPMGYHDEMLEIEQKFRDLRERNYECQVWLSNVKATIRRMWEMQRLLDAQGALLKESIFTEFYKLPPGESFINENMIGENEARRTYYGMNNYNRTQEIRNIYDEYDVEFDEDDAIAFSQIGESDTDDFFNTLGEQVSDPTACLDPYFDEDPFDLESFQ